MGIFPWLWELPVFLIYRTDRIIQAWLNKISPFLERVQKTMVGKYMLILLSLLLAAAPVQAQGMEAGYMQTISPSASIGPDQDSLLPPEVVPLDPASATALNASRAQSRQASMASGQPIPELTPGQSVPGLTDSAPNPMALRQQAFGQLLGDQTTLPPDAMNKIWRAGLRPQQTPPGQAPQDPNMMSQAPGMMQPAPDMAPAQLGGPNYQMANNQQMQQGYIAQSQTLTGASNNQPAQNSHNTRRGGLSNFLNYAGAFGAGAMTSGFWSNNPWMGAGMFGATMTGFGVRNNSRF